MGTHSYYQDVQSAEDSAAVRDVPMPRALWGVVGGMIIGSILLIALPVVMIVDRDGTYAAIRNDQPGLGASDMDFAFYAVIAFAVAVHAIDVALTIWFGLKAIRGRQWARIALTSYLVLATAGSAFSAMAVPTYLWAVVPGDGIHIIMLVLLWIPRSVRDFFAAHRADPVVE